MTADRDAIGPEPRRRASPRGPPTAARATPPRSARGPDGSILRRVTASGRRPICRACRLLEPAPRLERTHSHRGAGRHTSRPRSIIAWFQVAGSRRSSRTRAAAAIRRTVTFVRLATEHDTRRYPTNVHVHRDDYRPNAIAATADACGTDPGSCWSAPRSPGTLPTVDPDDGSGRLMQGDGPPVIAESGPCREHVGRRRGGEARYAREPPEEPIERRSDAGGLRLLQHHLADEDRVGTHPVPAPGIPPRCEGDTRRAALVEGG